jgi:hypothetical protein
LEFDFYNILESPKAQLGLSISFIIAAILLLLINIGITISFAKISITSIFGEEQKAFIQLYVIISLISLAITLLKNIQPNPFIQSDSNTRVCFKCSNPMITNELVCSSCGSTFKFNNEK